MEKRVLACMAAVVLLLGCTDRKGQPQPRQESAEPHEPVQEQHVEMSPPQEATPTATYGAAGTGGQEAEAQAIPMEWIEVVEGHGVSMLARLELTRGTPLPAGVIVPLVQGSPLVDVARDVASCVGRDALYGISIEYARSTDGESALVQGRVGARLLTCLARVVSRAGHGKAPIVVAGHKGFKSMDGRFAFVHDKTRGRLVLVAGARAVELLRASLLSFPLAQRVPSVGDLPSPVWVWMAGAPFADAMGVEGAQISFYVPASPVLRLVLRFASPAAASGWLARTRASLASLVARASGSAVRQKGRYVVFELSGTASLLEHVVAALTGKAWAPTRVASAGKPASSSHGARVPVMRPAVRRTHPKKAAVTQETRKEAHSTPSGFTVFKGSLDSQPGSLVIAPGVGHAPNFTVRMGGGTLAPSSAPPSVKRAMARIKAGILACYRRLMRRMGTGMGSHLKISYRLKEDGSITLLNMSGEIVGKGNFDSCVRRAFGRAKGNPSEPGFTPYTHTFTLILDSGT